MLQQWGMGGTAEPVSSWIVENPFKCPEGDSLAFAVNCACRYGESTTAFGRRLSSPVFISTAPDGTRW